MQSLAVDGGNKIDPNPSSSPLPAYPQCGWENCLSLQVSYVSNASKQVADYPWINDVLTSFKGKTGVDYEIRPQPISSFETLQDYYSEI